MYQGSEVVVRAEPKTERGKAVLKAAFAYADATERLDRVARYEPDLLARCLADADDAENALRAAIVAWEGES